MGALVWTGRAPSDGLRCRCLAAGVCLIEDHRPPGVPDPACEQRPASRDDGYGAEVSGVWS